MDKKRLYLNVSFSAVSKILTLIISLISKSAVVRYLGPEVNGLYSLFVDILGLLTIAELGIGTAITFSMYKPIVEGNQNKVSALYHTYRKIYYVLFITIFLIGISISPFLTKFSKEIPDNVNIYVTYILFLFSVTLNYLYAYKTSLIMAYKDNYITTSIHSSTRVIEGVIQIIVILLTKSFLLFLVVKVLSNFLEWIITDTIYRKKYKPQINEFKSLDKNTKKELFNNTKGLFMERLGYLLITTVDGIIIAYFVSVVSLGRYSNYTFVAAGVFSVLSTMFSSITSILGHSFVENSKEKMFSLFKTTYSINFITAFIFFMGFILTSNDIARILYGDSEIIIDRLIIIIGINYFVNFNRQATASYKTAAGLFHEDRYRTIIEGLINLVLSLLFVPKLFEFGVLLATVVTRLFISYIYEPYLLFKKGFEKRATKFYLINYSTVIIFSLSAIISIKFRIINRLKVISFILNGFISIGISFSIFLTSYLLSSSFRNEVNKLFKLIKIEIKKLHGKMRKKQGGKNNYV